MAYRKYMKRGIYTRFVKRLIDLGVALTGLVLLAPVQVLLILLLYIYNDKNIFFVQERPGKHERIFKLVKFKTMNDRKDAAGNLLRDKERMTRVGRFLRSTSLDELPQLFNVLVGDMSLIGPRPLLVRYLPLYNREQSRRHEVRPGITGWAQVNGRNALSWNERFKLDVWYVDNVSLALDVKIAWRTLIKVFKREGVNAGDGITMKPFTGNE
jgi:undecaprenyl phosphate N,N'-diacetylbacillosamine 1-phosphate transferase